MKKFDFNNPEDWVFTAIVYSECKSEDWAEYYEMMIEDMCDSNGVPPGYDVPMWLHKEARENADPDGRYKNRGTCDHCGAAFSYGAAFKNSAGEVAIVGNVCASTNLNLSAHEYADKKMRKTIKMLKTRRENEIKRAANREKLETMTGDLREALDMDHRICQSLRANFIEWGELTDGQERLALKLLAEKREEANKPEPLRPDPELLLGEPKQRLQFDVTVIKSAYFTRPAYMGDYDETVHVITMVDKKTKACLLSKSTAFNAEEGEELTIKGTIKEHSEYNGQAQTVLQRINVLSEKETAA